MSQPLSCSCIACKNRGYTPSLENVAIHMSYDHPEEEPSNSVFGILFRKQTGAARLGRFFVWRTGPTDNANITILRLTLEENAQRPRHLSEMADPDVCEWKVVDDPTARLLILPDAQGIEFPKDKATGLDRDAYALPLGMILSPNHTPSSPLAIRFFTEWEDRERGISGYDREVRFRRVNIEMISTTREFVIADIASQLTMRQSSSPGLYSRNYTVPANYAIEDYAKDILERCIQAPPDRRAYKMLLPSTILDAAYAEASAITALVQQGADKVAAKAAGRKAALAIAAARPPQVFRAVSEANFPFQLGEKLRTTSMAKDGHVATTACLFYSRINPVMRDYKAFVSAHSLPDMRWLCPAYVWARSQGQHKDNLGWHRDPDLASQRQQLMATIEPLIAARRAYDSAPGKGSRIDIDDSTAAYTPSSRSVESSLTARGRQRKSSASTKHSSDEGEDIVLPPGGGGGSNEEAPSSVSTRPQRKTRNRYSEAYYSTYDESYSDYEAVLESDSEIAGDYGAGDDATYGAKRTRGEEPPVKRRPGRPRKHASTAAPSMASTSANSWGSAGAPVSQVYQYSTEERDTEFADSRDGVDSQGANEDTGFDQDEGVLSALLQLANRSLVQPQTSNTFNIAEDATAPPGSNASNTMLGNLGSTSATLSSAFSSGVQPGASPAVSLRVSPETTTLSSEPTLSTPPVNAPNQDLVSTVKAGSNNKPLDEEGKKVDTDPNSHVQGACEGMISLSYYDSEATKPEMQHPNATGEQNTTPAQSYANSDASDPTEPCTDDGTPMVKTEVKLPDSSVDAEASIASV